MNAFEKIGKSIDYYALDLSEEELQRTLLQVPEYNHVRCHGLLGTYDDGKEWLKQFSDGDRHITIIHLGSSIGTSNLKEGKAETGWKENCVWQANFEFKETFHDRRQAHFCRDLPRS